MSEPNLGTTWSEAVESAYAHGYCSFENSMAEIVDIAREKAEEIGFRDAHHEMMKRGDYQAFVSGSKANRELWWAIDTFFENHMPTEEYEQLKREAAVAEDLDSAFEAGATDAIFGREYNVSRVSHLHSE